jgi:hypothetical protein
MKMNWTVERDGSAMAYFESKEAAQKAAAKWGRGAKVVPYKPAMPEAVLTTKGVVPIAEYLQSLMMRLEGVQEAEEAERQEEIREWTRIIMARMA